MCTTKTIMNKLFANYIKSKVLILINMNNHFKVVCNIILYPSLLYNLNSN